MNVVKIKGGLGNQMFQYAFGRVLSEEGSQVVYDLEWYRKGDLDRPYLLYNYNTNVKTAPKKIQRRIKEHGFSMKYFRLHGVTFDGYWQYYTYYKKYRELFKKIFTLNVREYPVEFAQLLDEILTNESIGIHVRRGDYLGKNFQVMPLDYYLKGLDLFKTKKSKIYIFSDDPEWCSENFKDGIIVQMPPVFDFELLKHCKYKIISCSTFSWWAAFLGETGENTVVCPKVFIVRPEDVNHYDNNIHYPDTWIKL